MPEGTSVIVRFPGEEVEPFVSVATVDALRALASSAQEDGGNVTVDGFLAAGDGGGGDYVWRANSLANDTGRSIIRPDDRTTLQAGRWILLGSDTSVFSVKDYGAVGDGVTNDSAAFRLASIAINAAGGGTLLIPPGIYIVGQQTFAGATGQGWAYEPEGIVYISGCTRPVLISGYGAVLKCAAGLKFGSFNPITGAIHNPVLPFVDEDYRATPYYAMIELSGNSGAIKVEGVELDGNLAALVLGGEWNDTGRQIAAYGIYEHQCDNVTYENVWSHHHAFDGLWIGYTGLTVDDPQKPHDLRACRFEHNARQGLSWVGGNNLTATSCKFSHTGRTAFETAPSAGLDMEAELSICRGGVFENCHFVDNEGVGMLAVVGDVADVSFKRCTFIGSYNYAVWPNKPGITFDDCLIVGSTVNTYASASSDLTEITRFIRSRLSGNTALSAAGVLFGTFLFEQLSATLNAKFENCRIDTDGNTTIRALAASVGTIMQDTQVWQDGTGEITTNCRWDGQSSLVFTGGTTNNAGSQIVLGFYEINGVAQGRTQDISFATGQGVKVAGLKVLGNRGAALPADATDLATALTLLNAVKARLKVTGGHGLVAD